MRFTGNGITNCYPDEVDNFVSITVLTLTVGADAVVVSVAGAFQGASTYQASSSAPSVATISVSEADVTVTPIAAGVTTITVTASGADNSVATQRFKVTVLAATTVGVRLFFVGGPGGFCERHGKSYLTRRSRGGEGGGGGSLTGGAVPSA